jgi:predicted dehydrogenase
MASTSGAAANEAPVRVGIIGYGLAGTVFHAPLIATTPGMRVAAIVTADPKRQERARADFPDATIYPTSEALLAKPAALDLVVVAAPNRAHVPLAIAALEAGLPVVVDKPVAPSSADAERLIAAARERGQMLSVFQNRRWDSDFLTARRLVQSGFLGAVVRLESRFERYRPASGGSGVPALRPSGLDLCGIGCAPRGSGGGRRHIRRAALPRRRGGAPVGQRDPAPAGSTSACRRHARGV